MHKPSPRDILAGSGLAILATLIWSGNFIVAKAVTREIPPIALSFYRWTCATLILLPFAWVSFRKSLPQIGRSWAYLLLIALMGISLFNTFIYIGAHYTSAINLALIGTTSSPIMSVILARIILKERIGMHKTIGILLCVTGVLFLLCKGEISHLLSLQFTEGDLWVLLAAFCFAVYNVMAKRKPAGIGPVPFLFTIFAAGTLLLTPAFIWEAGQYPPIQWNSQLVVSVLYLGLGASVICYLIWNAAIQKLGAGRTALFGNLIPIFSSLEAVLFLHEGFNNIHILSMALVFTGIIIANFKQ